MKGRVPLLQHEKALIINTTLFSEKDYKSALEAPMTRIIDDWGLRYPGVKKSSMFISIRYLQLTMRPGAATWNELTNWARILPNEKLKGETDAVQPEHENETNIPSP